MSSWTQVTPTSSSWSKAAPSLINVLAAGSPIGLLLALTHTTDAVISSFSQVTPTSTTWTQVTPS